jgi:hypothetical protein
LSQESISINSTTTTQADNKNEGQDSDTTPVYAPVTIHKTETMAMFDTGAARSCISRKFLNQLNKPTIKQYTGQSLTSFINETVQTQLVANLELAFAGVRLNHDFIVVDNMTSDLIIGTDIMHRKVPVSFSFHKARIKTRHGSVHFTCEQRDVLFKRQDIYLQGDLEFAPRSGIHFAVPTNIKPGTLITLTPNPELLHDTSIRAAGTLDVVSADGLVMINLVNNTVFPITLTKGTYLGDLNPVLHAEAVNSITISKPIEQTVMSDEDFITQFTYDPTLSQSQIKELQHILIDFRSLFRDKIDNLNMIQTKVKHHIHTIPGQKVQSQPYTYGPAERKIIDNEIDKLVASDLIQPSTSPWSSPVVLVRKKDGTIRFCIDYRKLNKITTRDMYPLPRLDHTIDSLAGMVYFSTMDCVSGYWQILMNNDDIAKTAFVTHRGLYEFKVMPFGLVNAPMTFQRAMDLILSGLKYEICLVYLDDIIVFGRTWKEHCDNLRTVLERLRSAGIYLKPKKCQFGKRSITFLGHTVSSDGVQTTSEKVKAVTEFKKPAKPDDIKSFLGLVNFYRPFIKNIAVMQQPLTNLLRDNQKWQWTEIEQKSFDDIKVALTTAPVLGLPDYTKPFILTTDASDLGIGAILSQKQEGKERVISYFSRPLNKAEKNYSITEKEAMAMVKAIMHFRPYLFGRRFTVITDHQALVYLQANRQPTGRLARWQNKLMDFEFDVIFRPGSKNTNADALSRYPVASISTTPVSMWPWTLEELIDAQHKDESINFIIDFVEYGTLPKDHFQRFHTLMYKREFLMDNGILYRLFDNHVTSTTVKQLVVPQPLRKHVLQSSHDAPMGGHYGFNRMFYRIRQHFYWPGMANDIQEYINTCHSCNARKDPLKKGIGDLQPLEATEPFDIIGMDLVGPLKATKEGYLYVLTIQDLFSKWVEAFPIRSKNATDIADIIVREIVCRFGSPRQILSDCGKEFDNQILAQICKLIGSVKIFTAPYRPQTDGQVERFNKTLLKQLSHYSNEHTDDWNKFLPHALFAYRVTPQTSTKASPFEILFGRIARSPLLNGLINSDDLHLDPDSYAAEISSRFLAAYDIVRSHIKDAQDIMAKYYNRNRRDFSYGAGDLVWVKIHKPKGTPKLSARWKGPFIIIKRTSDLNYVVKDLLNKKKKFTTNVNHIKPYISRSEISDQQPLENSSTNDHENESITGGKESPQTTSSLPPTTATSSQEARPDPESTSQRSTRKNTKNNSLNELAEILVDLRRKFEELAHYNVTAAKRQLSDLLTRGSIFVTSSTLNTKFKTQISQLKNRSDVLFFLQRITSHFNAEFAEQIYS